MIKNMEAIMNSHLTQLYLFKKMRSAGLVAILIIFCLSGCTKATPSDTADSNDNIAVSSESAQKMPVPIYSNAKILDESNFNTNNYTLLYTVDENYETLLNYYVNEFDLDIAYAGEDQAYYEGFSYGDVFIRGLTIESIDEGVNVYITYQTDDVSMLDSNEEESSSSILSYTSASEVNLDDNYPEDEVPIYSKAKIIGCSLAPSGSGFIDLILPSDQFDEGVAFYSDLSDFNIKLDSSTEYQKAVQIEGETAGYTVTILISQLAGTGNDPYVQITIVSKN